MRGHDVRLEDLVGDLSTVSDEELERAVATGRLAREGEPVTKAKKASSPRKSRSTLPEIDLSDFE